MCFFLLSFMHFNNQKGVIVRNWRNYWSFPWKHFVNSKFVEDTVLDLVETDGTDTFGYY